MAKIVLVNPNCMKPGVAPIGIDYLAESLAVGHHDVRILDLCFSDDRQGDLKACFRAHRPDLVGMSIRNTDDCYFASQDFFIPFFADLVADIKAFCNVPVVLGGAGLSVAPAAIMEMTGADYAIRGEGETALPMLASRLERGQDPSDVPGLVYPTPRGIKGNSPMWMDMADLPLRSRSWLDNRRYFIEGGQAGIETKRGCDRGCIYCADPVGKGSVCRVRPPSHIIYEIQSLLDQRIDCFHLCDSEFNIPMSHAKAVCQAIIDHGLGDKIRWYTYASPGPLTEELASLMKKAGCVGIDFGADSGDDGVLKSLGRDFTSDDVRRTAEICHRQGITFMYDLLIGGPAETLESVDQTIGLMKEIEPDRVGVSVGVRVYNGTALGNMVRREGLSRTNPALHGRIEDNDDLLYPLFYISPQVGLDVIDRISELTGGDPRFLHASREEIEGNYNYNDNSVLVDAIAQGYRGAYWDILRKVQLGIPPEA